MRSIAPVLLSKIKEQNQTLYNNANPKMSIQVSRAKDTVMDSTYWTVETIRTKEGLGDLSVAARRQKPYGRPDRLYNIYVDNGIVKTATREYPDKQRLKWQNQFDVGAGTAVAIAFDGFWELYRKKWQMVTSEKPWIFWVDTSGKLWGQVWDEVDTIVELASGVNKVKAIRGWRNINIPDVDQGVIVGYIKSDGKVYYRNYCYQVDGQFAWETEKQITEFPGTSVNLNMFITNDYRMGFIVEDSSGNISWAITSRAWTGMAIAPEKFNVQASADIEFIPVNYIDALCDEYFSILASAEITYLYGSDYNEFITIEQVSVVDENEKFIEQGGLNYGTKITFTVRHKIINSIKDSFEMLDENSVKFRSAELTKINDYTWTATFEDFNNAVGNLTLYNLAGYSTNEASLYFAGFNKSFTPINLVADPLGPPEVEVIWNE